MPKPRGLKKVLNAKGEAQVRAGLKVTDAPKPKKAAKRRRDVA